MLTNLTCQEYIDGTLEEALAAGCDAVQPKMDGWWTHGQWNHDEIRWFSKTGRNFLTTPAPMWWTADLIGEGMHGTQWAQDPNRKGQLWVFDVWGWVNEDIRNLPYRERMAKLGKIVWPNVKILPDPLRIVPTYPIAAYKTLWTEVEAGRIEGVVFRNTALPGTPKLIRQKNEVTAELRAKRVLEGDGKHQQRLGALVGETSDGVEVAVGGGFTDDQRQEIWDNPEKFLGKWFTITAKAKFSSGSFRHPNFSHWRDDLND